MQIVKNGVSFEFVHSLNGCATSHIVSICFLMFFVSLFIHRYLDLILPHWTPRTTLFVTFSEHYWDGQCFFGKLGFASFQKEVFDKLFPKF